MDRNGAATLTFCGIALVLVGASLVGIDGLSALWIALVVLGLACAIVGGVRFRRLPKPVPTREQLRTGVAMSAGFFAIGVFGLASTTAPLSSVLLLLGAAAMLVYSIVALRRMPRP